LANYRLKQLSALIGCASLLPAAYSQVAPVNLPTVEVSAAADIQQRHNSSLQQIVIPEEEVERYGDATVGDVLRRLPGMTFTGPAGVAKDIRMRGMDKGYTQFLINGEPVLGVSKDRQMQVDRLPADMIERIEIIRSPNAMSEAGGVGGVINIVLKNRADNLTRLRTAVGRNGDLDVGDAVIQWSRSFDDFDVLLAASHTVGAEDVTEKKNTYNVVTGAITAAENKPKPTEKSETLFAPRLTWRLGEDRLTIESFISDGTEDKIENATTRTGAGALSKSASTNEDKTDRLQRFATRYDGKLDQGTWFAKAGIQQGVIEKDKRATERNAAGTLTKSETEKEKVQEDGLYAGMGGMITLNKMHSVSSGIEWRNDEFDNNKQKRNVLTGVITADPKERFNVKENKVIVYAQDEIRLSENQWITPGVRYESTDRTATDSNSVSQRSKHAASNPSLHYRWAVSPDVNLRASVANTYKLPKFDQFNPLVTTKAGTLADPDTAGNSSLKPETATGIDFGIEKFFASGQGVLGINFYNRAVSDYIEQSTKLEGSRFVKRPYNAGDARFKGIEIDWRLPVMRTGGHSISLVGNHSEMRGKLDYAAIAGSGDVKDLPPRVTNLGFDWRYSPSQLTGGMSLNLQPTYTTRGQNDDGVTEMKTRNASKLLDLYVGKSFGPLAEIRLIAKNILSVDKEEETRQYTAAGVLSKRESKIETSEPTILVTFESRF